MRAELSPPMHSTPAHQKESAVRGMISEQMIKKISDSIADEIAKRMYYKLLMLKFLPEVREMQAGKFKGLKGKEIDEFFRSLKNSK